MVGIGVVTRAALLIARSASTWTVAEHLNGRSPVCVAVDTRDPTRVYCGTSGAAVFFRKPRQRPELGTSRTGYRPPDSHRGCCCCG